MVERKVKPLHCFVIINNSVYMSEYFGHYTKPLLKVIAYMIFRGYPNFTQIPRFGMQAEIFAET